MAGFLAREDEARTAGHSPQLSSIPGGKEEVEWFFGTVIGSRKGRTATTTSDRP